MFQKHVSGWHQMRISWQAPQSPPHAPLGTHGMSTAASGCVDSQQLRFVFASWHAWHCHFINYLWLLPGDELFGAAAANLTSFQETQRKHARLKPHANTCVACLFSYGRTMLHPGMVYLTLAFWSLDEIHPHYHLETFVNLAGSL